MKILVIGGTRFLGRHLAEIILARGHELTLFNRGQSNKDLFPEAEKLTGNRDGDLKALEGRRWDAVIDTCGYVPRIVKQSAGLLASATDHYTFVSTLSVYSDVSQEDIDENSPVGKLEDETTEEITGEAYGPLKVLCEKVVEEALPGRALIVRPGLIVGPFDPTDRFTYWPYRVDQGGAVLAPGNPARTIQFIDVRDLAGWIVKMVEDGRTGVYNANGPDYNLSMGELLDSCQKVSGSDARFEWLPESFLLENRVEPWMELPLWIPESDPAMRGFFKISSAKAIAEGLTFLPLDVTVRDTLAWNKTRPDGFGWRAGMKPEREQELLKKYQATLENSTAKGDQ
ncbi:MAG TPA: SDR family oxidoreductase [Chloroflexia bacterium]|nr:SDR family oxidoreductase [Chloroflexia bacterium]